MFDAHFFEFTRLCLCDFAFYKNAEKFNWENTKKQISFVYIQG